MKRIIAYATIAVMCVTALGACTQNAPAINLTLAKAQTDAQQAVAVYGIAKGIALAAELANPGLAPSIDSAIALADPIVAKVQLALSNASDDVTAIEALVAQVQAQANTLAVQGAPAIKVVPAS